MTLSTSDVKEFTCQGLFLIRIETVYGTVVPDQGSFRFVKAEGSIIVARAALRPYVSHI